MSKYESAMVVNTETGLADVIRATAEFGDVKPGYYGGLLGQGAHLSKEGNCWVYPSATVVGKARISDNAKIRNYSVVTDVAEVCGDVSVSMSTVSGNAFINGNMCIEGAYLGVGANIYSKKDYIVLEDGCTAYRGERGIIVASNLGVMPLNAYSYYTGNMCNKCEVEDYFGVTADVSKLGDMGYIDLEKVKEVSGFNSDSYAQEFMKYCECNNEVVQKLIIAGLTGWNVNSYASKEAVAVNNELTGTIKELLALLAPDKLKTAIDYLQQLSSYEG